MLTGLICIENRLRDKGWCQHAYGLNAEGDRLSEIEIVTGTRAAQYCLVGASAVTRVSMYDAFYGIIWGGVTHFNDNHTLEDVLLALRICRKAQTGTELTAYETLSLLYWFFENRPYCKTGALDWFDSPCEPLYKNAAAFSVDAAIEVLRERVNIPVAPAIEGPETSECLLQMLAVMRGEQNESA